MNWIPLSPTSLRRAATTALLAAMFTSPSGCKPQASDPETPDAGLNATQAAAGPKLLDDYSDPVRNKNGVERLLIDDKSVGSRSRATARCEAGVLSVNGELSPGRGAPAFISHASPLSVEGAPLDMSGYEGVRLRVKIIKGLLIVQTATSTITNFDYHASAPIAGKGGDFQEVRVPFKDMKRAWSEQTVINLKSVTSINLVSFGMARGAFAYEVDEIGFY